MRPSERVVEAHAVLVAAIPPGAIPCATSEAPAPSIDATDVVSAVVAVAPEDAVDAALGRAP